MNDKCCKVALLNIRLPFLEAVEYLTTGNDGTHVAFVRLSEDEQKVESLFCAVDDSLVKMVGFDKFDGIDEKVVGNGHLAISDLSHENFRLVHTCGEKKAHFFQPSYYEEYKAELSEEHYRTISSVIIRKLILQTVHTFNSEGLGSKVSIDISAIFS